MGLAWRRLFSLEPLQPKEARTIYLMLALGVLVRLILALILPITNDEAYYWDWGQDPRLSYYDHPPGVSYLTYLGTRLVRWCSPFIDLDLRPWEARFFAPWVFAVGSFFLIKTLLLFFIKPSLSASFSSSSSSVYKATKNLSWILILVPGISLLGCLALPDIGLMATSAMALYVTVLFLNKQNLTALHGILYGTVFGGCGLFKYHALLLCGGMGAFLLVIRSRREWGFWIMVAITGFMVCLPVWIWNYSHGGASILFQLDHGFGGPQFRIGTGLRLVMAQLVILGLWYIVSCFSVLKWVRRIPNRHPLLAPLGAALPLMAVVLGASFFKEMMPHWLIPGWILLTPLVAYHSVVTPQADSKLLNYFKWTWPALVLSLLLAFSNPWVQHKILGTLNDDPGALSEITVWEPLASTVQQLRSESLESLSDQPSEATLLTCPREPLWAAVRWYGVAQLRYHLKGQPNVYSLDPHHDSYYGDRDSKDWPVGCPVWVVAHGKSLDRRKILEWVDVIEEKPLSVPGHRRQPWILLQGTLKSVPLNKS